MSASQRILALTATLLAHPVMAQAASTPHEQGLFRGRPVIYVVDGDKKLFEGDILLDHVAPFPSRNGGSHALSVGVAYSQFLWPKNSAGVASIPYVVTSAATQLDAALAAFNTTFKGTIQFVKRTTQTDYVSFDFDPNNFSGQCESNVGRVGGMQTTGGSGSCNLGTLLHEMGHVVGLYHEQSRPDRSSFVTVNFGNVIKGSEDNFNQLSDNFQDLTLFDYASVMEYIPFAFSRNGGPVMDSIPAGIPLSNLTGYTAADIDGIKRLYGKAPKTVTVTSNPPGLAVVVDGTTVTTPQVYDWALNSTHTLAVGVSAQTLSGGTYVYGRWNDSTAASHSITVTHGNNHVAQPANLPAVTVYTANFVQLSAYSATVYPSGAGTVSVSPSPQTYSGASGSYFVARQPVTLSAAPASGYGFVTWGGTSAPLSANAKSDYVPDGAAPYAVTADFSTQPITTITTNPAGFYFTVDGNYYKGPQSFTSDVFGSSWNAGTSHTLTGFSPSEPYSINSRFLFQNWSDGGALSHNFIVPASASTITGSFTAQYGPVVYANPGCAGTITLKPASSDGFYNAGTNLTVSEKPESGWLLSSWTGDLTVKRATQTLAVTDEELAVANYNTAATPFKLNSLIPASYPSGGPGGTLKIKGTGFTAGSYAYVNNAYRASTFVSSSEIDVPITASDLTIAGAIPVGVANFPPGGSCSLYDATGLFILR